MTNQNMVATDFVRTDNWLDPHWKRMWAEVNDKSRVVGNTTRFWNLVALTWDYIGHI